MEELPFGCQETKFLPLGRLEEREFSPLGIPHFNRTVSQTHRLILPEERHAVGLVSSVYQMFSRR